MAEAKTDNVEMITGDPKKAIVKLAVPMALSMLLIMLYNIADSIWVSGLGPEAIAAVGFVTPLYIILVGLGNGVAAGTNSLISRFIGAENYQQANNAALHGILLSAIISSVFTIIAVVFMVPILDVLGVGNTMRYALDYSYIIFGLSVVFVFEELLSAIFRSEGDARRATGAIAVTAVVNMVLDPLFIYIFGWGISGAAWATVLSSVLSCIIMGYWIWFKKDLYLDLTLKNYTFQTNLITENLQVAIPSTFESLIFSALAIAINLMLQINAGYVAVGIYSVAMRVVQFATLPLIAIGTAVVTVAGVAYGAKNPKNLNTTLSYSIKISFLISIVLVAVMFIFSPQIALLFSYTEASSFLAPQIAGALSILCFFTLTVPLGIMSTMVFQGVGKGMHSFIITLFRSLVFDSLFAYIFGFVFGWGLNGIYAGVVFGSFIGGIFGYILAKRFIKKFTNEVLENNSKTIG
ncbi:MATE family efflux transporter [Methanobrevibacter sp.]|uniref:MATE family efflux transporter n=1 Tax=Methanobrevibacter sp. TaxID=66852 RepID=UPI00388EE89B